MAATSANRGNEIVLEDKLETIQYTAGSAGTCSYCRNKRYERSRCPAKDKFCFKCEKRGQLSKVCRSRSVKSKSSCTSSLLMQIKPESTGSASSKLNIPVQINGVATNALVDTGSTLSHLSERFVKIDLKLKKSSHIVGLAVKGLTSESLGMTTISVKFNGTVYDRCSCDNLKRSPY